MGLKQTGVELVAKGEAQFNSAMKQAGANVQQFGQNAQKASQQVNAAGGGMNQAAQQVQKFSASARGGFMAAAQSATLLGQNISSVAGPLNSAVSGLTQLASAGMMLGPVGIVVGGISIALGALIAKLQEQEEAAKKATEAIVKGYRDAHAELQKMMEPDPFEKTARSIGVSAKELRDYAATSAGAAAQVDRLVLSQEKQALAQINLAAASERLLTAQRGLAQAQADQAAGFTDASMAVEVWTSQVIAAQGDIARYANEIYAAKDANAALTGEINTNVGALIQQRSIAATAFPLGKLWTTDFNVGAQTADWWGNRTTSAIERVQNAMGIFSDPLDQWAYDQIKAYQEGQTAAQEWARKTTEAYNKVKGAVESAISPTKVTEEDVEAAKEGRYKEKWDETRRRLEAVAKGTPPELYGPQFQQQLKDLQALGYTIEGAIEAYENWTLFAEPENVKKFANLDAVYQQINTELEGMVGKANVVNEVMANIWDKLSPTAKQALAVQGIDSATEAVKEMINPAGAAEDKVKGLKTQILGIPEKRSTEFNVVKAPTFDPNLQKILDDLSLIEKEADIVVTIYYESKPRPPNGGTPPDPNVPPAGGGPGGYQHGGWGVFPDTRSVLVHAGEGFWFSGIGWNVPFPDSFERRIQHPAPASSFYNSEISAPINININAPITGGSRADVDRLANQIAGRLRDQLLTQRRARA